MTIFQQHVLKNVWLKYTAYVSFLTRQYITAGMYYPRRCHKMWQSDYYFLEAQRGKFIITGSCLVNILWPIRFILQLLVGGHKSNPETNHMRIKWFANGAIIRHCILKFPHINYKQPKQEYDNCKKLKIKWLKKWFVFITLCLLHYN